MYFLIVGRRTTHNPFTSRDKPWDPYGIAKFDLSGLLLGHKYLYLRSPIHCCPLPDTQSGLQKPDGPIVGHPGNVDGPGKRQIRALLKKAVIPKRRYNFIPPFGVILKH